MLQKIRGMTAFGMRMVESVLPQQRRVWQAVKWGLRQGADLLEPNPNQPASEPASVQPEAGAQSKAKPVTPLIFGASDLENALQAESPPIVIDVREPRETAQGVIPGARLIPMNEVLASIGTIREAGRPVVVYCAHGIRSANVATHLRDRGIEAFTLQGGIEAWHRSGGKVVPPTPQN